MRCVIARHDDRKITPILHFVRYLDDQIYYGTCDFRRMPFTLMSSEICCIFTTLFAASYVYFPCILKLSYFHKPFPVWSWSAFPAASSSSWTECSPDPLSPGPTPSYYVHSPTSTVITNTDS